jgi:Skp family chaperone for outer membrane proteins
MQPQPRPADNDLRDAELVTRLIEITQSRVNRTLNDESTAAIVELYDDIYGASVAMSEAHGLSALMAYPDAVSEEERNSATVKEAKLKPPAAQPFYLHPSADYTDELLARLHGKGEAALPKRPAPPKAADGKVPAGTKIGCFNMAAVMRDYGKAKYQVYQLNQKRNDLSGDLITWRSRYIKLQQDIGNPRITPEDRDQMSKEMLKLARKIEDKDRDVNKVLNDDATKIISELYDDIDATVTQVAKEKGLSVVMAYPDAVTDEEKKSAFIKELKLKPPAAQPFYLDPSADYTREIINRVNAKHPAPEVPLPSIPPIPAAKPGKP